LVLAKTDFNQLPGWENDDPREALKALQRSCVVIAKQNPSQSFSISMPHSGKVENWQNICRAAENFKPKDASSARKFFETWFLPHRIYDNTNPEGLFTGYYLPKLNCRLKKSKRFCEPIYAIPEDWVKVDLGLFKENLKGTTIVGQVKDKSLRPYPKRSTIVHREFRKKAQVLFWCDDRIDVFFAQIQGSAIVQLPHGKSYLIAYSNRSDHRFQFYPITNSNFIRSPVPILPDR
jgi:membrane-bound lytic murein transglycosylase A